ncbi:hypothetical protein SD70_10835 [Gordoniibacillus kamchatkensis]|uniref:ROK family protein n=1 Tax=Gordoniibacillus kamchatkensis TaxID=1590651 RepID=A0ABR5AJH7_9BACL|nr:ROK family protein [Paenibacillus sp. VKM B-2647]KIL40908.1 hypothetical protein SD70_10835 [Paenibacillus sp. VKM B-2647]
MPKKFVSETGLGDSTKEGGRRAIKLGFNPKSGYGVGVEITKSGLHVCIADLDGNIDYLKRAEIPADRESIHAYIVKSLDEIEVPMDKVISLGFSIPGLTNSVDGIIVDAPELKWEQVPFVAEMKRYFDKPIYINNDVNCSALAERWIGAAQNIDDFVYIHIGAGVGSAIVANGSLVHGKDYMAGELGYLVLEEDLLHRNFNNLGEYGVFDKKVSGQALAQYASSVEALFAEARRGAEASSRVVNRFVNHLSLGIANIVSLLNPEKVIIGGEVSRFMQPVVEQIQSTVSAITPIRTAIGLSGLGEEAGALGAISFAFEQEKSVI